MAKKTNEYFLLIEQQAAIWVEAAALLENILTAYSAAGMAVRRVEMHAVERRADGICHDIRNRLSAAFITPIDQEDILHLAQLLDDVTDALDEVALECYMFRLAELPAGAPAFAGLTRRCVGKLCATSDPQGVCAHCWRRSIRWRSRRMTPTPRRYTICLPRTPRPAR